MIEGFHEDMVLRVSAEGKTKQDVLAFLAGTLCMAGYVKESYRDGILHREEIYPTGLATGHINVAVPHTDCEHVRENAIAVGLLDVPVSFRAMDDPSRDVAVSIVIMLALKEPHGQVDMLQKIIALVKQQDDLKRIVEAKETKQAYQIIAGYLG